MTDSEYLDLAEAALAAIERACDRINDDSDADIDNQRVGGMITLVFEGGRQLVVNLQKPLQEIWLAAPSGGYHYRHDGSGWRDHSWGPRYWQSIYWYRLFLANFGDGRGFMLLKIATPDGHARRVGVLMVDGQYEDITDMDVFTDWTLAQDPKRVWLNVRTATRAETIEGEVLSLAPLRNRRKADGQVLVSRIAEGFTRLKWEGREGYGMTEYIERIENDALVGYPL